MLQILQPTPTSLSATATLTIDQMMARIVMVTSAVAVSLTLPTGTLCDAGIGSGNVAGDNAFDWCLLNSGSVSGLVSILAGTGHTINGLATIAIVTSGMFRTRKTGTNTFVTYRLC